MILFCKKFEEAVYGAGFLWEGEMQKEVTEGHVKRNPSKRDG